jgi:trigger factor
MTEDTQTTPEITEPQTETPTPETSGEDKGKEKKKVKQTVDIKDSGPCRKHIKVTVERADIDASFEEKFRDLVSEAWVPGFRPGKAPKSVIMRKFKQDVHDKVKSEVLLSSLEQLAEEFDVAPLSPPNLDPRKLDIPDKGDFVYEFDVEVRPHFDLPEYKGLTLKQPVHQFSDAEVDAEQKQILSRDGQLVPKDGAVEKNDFIIVDMRTSFNGEQVGESKEVTLRVEDTLTFKDSIAQKFGEQVIGAKAGDKRTIDITMTDAVAVASLRGQTLRADLDIKDVKQLRLPELDEEFLSKYGCKSVDQFRERIRLALDNRLAYHQRQSAREQVLGRITASATWELPQDLLQRQARKTLARRVMEMRESGMGEDEIQGRQRMLQRDVLASTAQALKEHFVLQKIAEEEKIELKEEEIDDEIDRIAETYGESPRRIRAQFERDELMETLGAQLIERKVLNLILEHAKFEEVPLREEPGVATTETQAVAGELADPTAAPPAPAEEKPAEDKPAEPQPQQ